MSNSSLANFFSSAKNYSKGRDGKKIRKITIHHMAGKLTAKECWNVFQTREASAHYGIGWDTIIGQYVDEADTAWADGNWTSNCESVTIETSNSSTGGEWPVSDEVLNTLIKLVADIAKRNNLGKLVPGQNLTWHQMYAATACPGPYLLARMQYIADEANKLNEEVKPKPEETTSGYLVKVNTACLNIRAGAGTNYAKVGEITDRGVYTIVAEADGQGANKWGKLKSGVGWIALDYTIKQSNGAVKQTYIVQPGDNLSIIAAKFGTTWEAIYANNKEVIGGNPNIIHAGQVLEI
jgi:hypothetical protein